MLKQSIANNFITSIDFSFDSTKQTFTAKEFYVLESTSKFPDILVSLTIDEQTEYSLQDSIAQEGWPRINIDIHRKELEDLHVVDGHIMQVGSQNIQILGTLVCSPMDKYLEYNLRTLRVIRPLDQKEVLEKIEKKSPFLERFRKIMED